MDDREVASENWLLHVECEKSPGGWGLLWDAGKSILGLCKTVMECLKEEPKVGKRKDQGALRRNKHGEIEGKWDKRDTGQHTCLAILQSVLPSY